MNLDVSQRKMLADGVLARFKKAAPGSDALLRGSLADGTYDIYSDIDVLWEIPDSLFKKCIDNLWNTISEIHPLESLRSAPEFQKSEKRRLIFARFKGVPLFWRLDIDIFAQSVERDLQYDVGNPEAQGSDWSETESALMNVIAAVKAYLRSKDTEARELMDRAYERMGLELQESDLQATAINLIKWARKKDSETKDLAERIEDLVVEVF